MKTFTIASLLFAAIAVTAAPTRDQVALNGNDDISDEPTYTITITTSVTAFTTVTLPPPTRTTPTPQASISATSTPHETEGQSLWDWIFHPKPPNRKLDLDANGCFCAGGSVCCYEGSDDISCGYGACGI